MWLQLKSRSISSLKNPSFTRLISLLKETGISTSSYRFFEWRTSLNFKLLKYYDRFSLETVHNPSFTPIHNPWDSMKLRGNVREVVYLTPTHERRRLFLKFRDRGPGVQISHARCRYTKIRSLPLIYGDTGGGRTPSIRFTTTLREDYVSISES